MTNGQSGDMELANSGRVSPHGFSMAGRKWKGFSSVSNEEEVATTFLYFNEAEEGVFGILEDGEGTVGFLTKEEDVGEGMVWGLLLVEEQRLLSVVGSCLLLAVVNKSFLLLIVPLPVLVSLVLIMSVLVTGGCIALTDAWGSADIGRLCSVYGACTA